MRVGLMQPYLFPYIGYFQLIKAVDLFIVYDDAQYIKNGWINRNRILAPDDFAYITLPVKKDSHKKNINQRFFNDNIETSKQDIRTALEEEYSDAPFFNDVMNCVNQCFEERSLNVAEFVGNSIRVACQYLGIETKIMKSSDIDKTTGLRAQDRVIDIVKNVGGESYLNAVGGTELYDKKMFLDNGIDLSFLRTKNIQYPQFDNAFVPSLSIIDVMMFNSKEQITQLLVDYELI